ncbi:MAG: hypothetical protein WA955_15840 [Diaphorobacter nitroreducens]|uniref:hypothetical protein n=1 Tax=Diaphorobacter nitroreducens TaxID=164759 RepID=UPI003C72825C
MTTEQSLVLSELEVQSLTGYKRAKDQIPELHRQGFFRARQSRSTGAVILERAHYEAVCSGRVAANESRTKEPMVRRLRSV